jgi:hypothetical protein
MEAHKIYIVYRAYHEGLRDAAKERHTASVQGRAPARFAGLRTAAHAITCWLREHRPVRARRVPAAPSLASDSALEGGNEYRDSAGSPTGWDHQFRLGRAR